MAPGKKPPRVRQRRAEATRNSSVATSLPGGMPASALRVEPLTTARWPDLLELFGPHGACFGCWCQYWRQPRAEWRQATAARNKADLEAQAAASAPPPGLIGYDASGKPAGWVSLGPREGFPGLKSSRFFGETEEAAELWSIVCFFIPPAQRHRGMAGGLLLGAIDFARKNGVQILEGYPWDLTRKTAASSSLYVGTFKMFLAAGFTEVSRLVPHRPVVRLKLNTEG